MVLVVEHQCECVHVGAWVGCFSEVLMAGGVRFITVLFGLIVFLAFSVVWSFFWSSNYLLFGPLDSARTKLNKIYNTNFFKRELFLFRSLWKFFFQKVYNNKVILCLLSQTN